MSISSRKVAFLVVGAVAAIALVYSLPVFRMRDIHEDTCEGLTAIAKDSQKMKYVRTWIASRTKDKAFMDEVRRSRFFERGDPRLKEYIDLDWGYLGFTPEFASLDFNVKDAGNHDFDATEIDSVSLSQSRVSIIIKLNEAGDLGLSWSPEALRKITPVGNDVFVNCYYYE